jgi:hypothetical protein
VDIFVVAVISQDEEFNPYAPPRAVECHNGNTEVDKPASTSVRRDHLHREAAVRVLGLSCYVFALYAFVEGIVHAPLYLARVIRSSEIGPGMSAHFSRAIWQGIAAYVVAGFALACLAVALGRGLRRLIPLARWGCIAFLTLYVVSYVAAWRLWREDRPVSSVGAALWTIAYGCALALLLSPSTAKLFTPDYREAVSRSPSLKPQLSLGAMIAIGVNLSLFVGGSVLQDIDVAMR